MDEVLTAIRSLLELGFPAVVLMQLAILWRAYVAATSAHIEDLRRCLTLMHALHVERQLRRLE